MNPKYKSKSSAIHFGTTNAITRHIASCDGWRGDGGHVGVSLMPHILVQQMPQLAIWEVVVGGGVMVDPYGNTPSPITTHHMVSCGICCAKIYRLIPKYGGVIAYVNQWDMAH